MEEAEKKIKEILDKYKAKIGYQFVFPMYRILPDEVRLALKVLEKNGMKVVITFESKDK